jgi:hypothetical protein
VAKINAMKLSKITGDVSQNLNFAIKPEVLRMFLDANRVSYKSGAGAKATRWRRARGEGASIHRAGAVR